MSMPATGPVADLSTLLDQLAGTTPPAPTTPAATDADPSATEPVYPDLDAFVREYLAVVVERRVAVGSAGGVHWCPQWWRHPEAISKLYALWRAWESLRVADQHTGVSIWWRDHFEPHFGVLTSEWGAFGRCGPERGHTDGKPLPVEPAPLEVLAQLPDYEQHINGDSA